MRVLTGNLVAAILLVTATSATHAQEAGAKLGLDIATISSFNDPQGGAPLDPDWRIAFTAGVFLHFPITDRIGFQPEVMFAMNGAGLTTTGGDATIQLTDLEVPLLLKLGSASASTASFYVVGGVSPLLNLNSNVALDSGGEVDVDDSVKRGDIGLTVGSGVQGRRWLIEGRFTHGLRDIAEETLQLDRGTRRRAFAVLGGVRF